MPHKIYYSFSPKELTVKQLTGFYCSIFAVLNINKANLRDSLMYPKSDIFKGKLKKKIKLKVTTFLPLTTLHILTIFI